MAHPARASDLGSSRPPEPPARVFVPLHCCRTTAKERFLLLNDSVFGLNTHWDCDRPRPCTKAVGRCLFCESGWNERWRGWCGAVRLVTGQRCVVQLTDWSWRACADLRGADGQLRGRTVSLWRETLKPQSKLLWAMMDLRVQCPPAPPIDLAAFLGRLFGIDLGALAHLRDFDGDLRPYMRPWKREKGGRK